MEIFKLMDEMKKCCPIKECVCSVASDTRGVNLQWVWDMNGILHIHNESMPRVRSASDTIENCLSSASVIIAEIIEES